MAKTMQSDWQYCPVCHGACYVPQERRAQRTGKDGKTETYTFTESVECKTCGGSGQVRK